MPKPRYNQNITVTIRSLGANGEGVGHWHGYTLFVDRALPGEEVRGRLIDRQRKYGRIRVDKILTLSPLRVDPPCPFFEKCGGCQLMHLAYEKQLEAKRQRVIDDFRRFGRFEDIEVPSCIPSPHPYRYRNKMQVPVVQGTEGIAMGLYARNSHDLVDIDHCWVHCEQGERVYGVCREILREVEVVPFDPETSQGELRYVLIKSAVHTNEVLVVFVAATPPSESLRRAAKALIIRCSTVKGVIANLNDVPDNVVLGQTFEVLEGCSTIQEKILDLTFNVSPASFFQVNPFQAEQLYSCAIEYANLTGHEKVLDAYCGVGTLALLLSAKAAEVIGVECISEAIEDAKRNAELNHITNTRFVCDNAESFIAQLNSVDVVVLNPPRKGCDPSFLQGIATLRPKRVVYISCDPATLGRDLAILRYFGYVIEAVQPFDMFPQTAHVETVVKLVLGKFYP